MYMNDNQDIEKEKLYNSNSSEYIEQFDPKMIHIESKSLTISNIVDRLENDEIILDPDYQRNGDLWDDDTQSRLIESLIIGIPLPVFYFDCCLDDKYEVVDGVQRLTAIKRFMAKNAEKTLKLNKLEYMTEFNGKFFDDLPANIQRRIREQNIQAYIIMQGTPNKIKSSIFRRINTGGLVLTNAEIRNAIYRGRVAMLLKELALSGEFVDVTRGSISPRRMLDREFVNRFLAFFVLGIEKYEGNLESFLNDVLEFLEHDSEENYNRYKSAFNKSMNICLDLFGHNAFRKITINENDKYVYSVINKPLFDCVSVSIARLTDEEQNKLINNKDLFFKKYVNLVLSEEFRDIISNGTATCDNVRKRHMKMREIINEVLCD